MEPTNRGEDTRGDTPDVSAKKRHPYIYGFGSGLVAALGLIALLLQVDQDIDQRDPPTNPKEQTHQEPQVADSTARRSMSSTELQHSVSDLAARILRLQKPDGSIQVLVSDPNWPSQTWTTAQALAAVLTAATELVIRAKESLWRGAHFIADNKNPAGGGWQKYPGQGPSILEPTAWAAIFFTRMIAARGLSGNEETVWLHRLAEESVRDLLEYQDSATGAFATVFGSANQEHYSYSTTMALTALRAAQEVGVGDQDEISTSISRGVAWLQKQAYIEGGVCRFLASPGAPRSSEPDGLTAQVLYALAACRLAGHPGAAEDCDRAFLHELLEHTPLATAEASFQMVSVPANYAKQIRTLWYPWTLLWLDTQLAQHSESLDRKELLKLKAALLSSDYVDLIVKSFNTDETWRIAEVLGALGSVQVD